jgi:hypothetical protein
MAIGFFFPIVIVHKHLRNNVEDFNALTFVWHVSTYFIDLLIF